MIVHGYIACSLWSLKFYKIYILSSYRKLQENKKNYLQQYSYSTTLFILDLTNAFQNSELDYSLILYLYHLDFQIPRYYFNYIKIDVLNRHFHSKMYFLFVYMLHTRFLHNKFLLYIFLLYAITSYFGVIHSFQAFSIKPDQSWVQSVKNNID